MRLSHLKDDQIQAYVDHDIEAEKVESHLQSCGSCRAEVEEYRKLLAGLGSVEPDGLSNGFVDNVMTAIPVGLYKGTQSVRSEFVLAASGIVMLLGAILYFVDLSMLAGLASQDLSASIISILPEIDTARWSSLTLLSSSYSLLGAAALILMLVPLLEAALKRHRANALHCI